MSTGFVKYPWMLFYEGRCRGHYTISVGFLGVDRSDRIGQCEGLYMWG